jgi:acyl-CoA reductase-like NAD-dependent aldehyde dehydrogenase
MVDTAPASAADRSGPARVPAADDPHIVSTSPATGAELARYPVADAAAVAAAVDRAREAGRWWAGLDFADRRRRLLRWRTRMAARLPELADLLCAETGKPTAEGVVEAAAAVTALDWAARHARRVLRPRRVRRALAALEDAARLEYRPYGVVGVIGPWNYPVLTPVNSIAYALAAGNAVVHKPSEVAPATGQWLADSFAEVAGEQPVLQTVHGAAGTGAALCRSGIDKLSFTGSTATARKVLAACSETLTPVTIEAGGKDAMIVDADANLDRAAEACAWGALTNAGQTCVGIERVYVVDSVYDDFLAKLVAGAGRITPGSGPEADIGPITTPAQLEVIRRHIDDALARGGTAVLGGAGAVRPPYVHPTILVDVPDDALAVREETFGPTLVVSRVADAQEGLARANATPYGLGGAVFGRRRARHLARGMRSGMVSVNDVIGFAAVPSLPWGGVGVSGIGRIRGDDGLREFSQAKSIVVRQAPSLLASRTFARTGRDIEKIVKAMQLLYGRRPR